MHQHFYFLPAYILTSPTIPILKPSAIYGLMSYDFEVLGITQFCWLTPPGQRPFQEPKLEVYPQNMALYGTVPAQYLHFRILDFPLTRYWFQTSLAMPDIRTPSAPAVCRLSALRPWGNHRFPLAFFGAWEDGILTDFLVPTWLVGGLNPSEKY